MIKSSLTEAPYQPQDDTYPCLKRFGRENAGEFVVLFTSFGTGTVVQVDDITEYGIGYHSDCWTLDFFERLPVGSTVALSNL